MSQSDAAFRVEVRAFLDRALPREKRHVASRLETMTQELARWWQRTLADQGWALAHWPKELGGPGWPPGQLRIFAEESAYAGAPLISPFGPVMVGPIIAAHGTAAQKAEHLPAIARGERLWCQGYSEPGAGSDLALLRTRAVRDGEVYRVTGQKIWTTQAHWADWIFCLVRTDDSGRRQEGITFLLIDMRSPGITVRPIRSIDGLHHLNEVFFDDVAVPTANRIGEDGAGWAIAKQLLGEERSSIADVAGSRVELDRYRALAREGRNPAISRPAIAARFAELDRRLATLAALELSPVSHAASARHAAMLKLLGSELSQDIAELGIRVLGPAALPMPDGSGQPVSLLGRAGEEAAASFLFGRAHSIYGGTSEVQRSLIAKLAHVR